ncbi:glutamine amidotransferase-like class 1 domain-containing protein 3A, mitochondrial [Cervus elaphus]|uniref:glutamine amidotransferase-like class 1 domain-containing protein 3A, mitochondrial n=1 Tax=Cervus elaphus TaxID=9860 RepID=UPI001CC2B6FE|nr:glutamine amidotransferase-like class 1 domain-containing protein 3A, mitochondrial [Cervus elaphus]
MCSFSRRASPPPDCVPGPHSLHLVVLSPIRRQGALECSPLRPSGSKAQLRALLLADATFLWQPRASNFGWPVHLRHQGKVKIFAPNAEQMHIINHLKESPAEERRNVLEESARRASEDALDLADLKFSELGAVSVTGSFGVAQNCTVNSSVKDTSRLPLC